MNYQQMARRASTLIKKYDKRNPKMRLELRRAGAINITTGEYEQNTITKEYLNAVVTNYTTNQIDGQMIKVGDLKLICDNKIKPQIGDFIVIDGTEYTVLEPIIEYNPGGIVIAYECQVRR